MDGSEGRLSAGIAAGNEIACDYLESHWPPAHQLYLLGVFRALFVKMGNSEGFILIDLVRL